MEKSNSKKLKTNEQRSKKEKGGTQASKQLCKNVNTPQGCRFGEKCHFRHSSIGKLEANPKTHNRRVKSQSHGKMSDQPSISTATTKTELSPEITFFLKSILKKMKEKQINQPYFIGQLDVELWKSAMDVVATKDTNVEFLSPLLRIYLALPHTATNTPNTHNVVLLILKQLENIQTLDQLDFVSQVLAERLLKDHSLEWINQKDRFLEIEKSVKRFDHELPTQIAKLSQKFSRDLSNFLQVANVLTTKWQEYKQALTTRQSAVKSYSSDTKSNSSLSFDGWYRNPTIEWLVGGEWYEQVTLRKDYETTNDYIATIQKLWTQLSFYWGLAAFWPKCRCETTPTGVEPKDGKRRSMCNAPLLCPVQSSRQRLACSMTFRNKGRCTGDAVFMCATQRSHDAICLNCIQKKIQDSLRGPSEQRATSTDVYDAVVRDITHRNESIILNLTNVMSRKPPEVAVNWKTSYRLQPACLVGVVVLHYRKADIPLTARLHWGEIIIKDPSKEDYHEYNRRVKGELTIRLLSKNDSSLLTLDSEETFKNRSFVAVIDFRVFVPEVFSVLSTLFLPSFKRGIECLPFHESLLRPAEGVQRSENELIFDHSDRPSAILKAIFNSRVSGIRKLTSEGKMKLLEEICDIPQVKTLDRTQLQAFCQGLLQDCHCTLGPPGTGKSYVGVCLVLALYQVKKHLMKEGHSVGPIIALSYKNHALDEFLNDVKNSCPELQRKKGQLIRIGRPELVELQRFTEKSSVEESSAKTELDTRIALLRASKAILRSIVKMITEEIPWEAELLFHILKTFSDSLVCCMGKSLRDVEPEEAYKILKAATNSDPSTLAMEMIPFVRDVEHWRVPSTTSRVNELFHQWLDGQVPPPRCSHTLAMKQCLNCSSDGSDYCLELHRCVFKPFCADGVVGPPSPYCANHCCRVPDCEKQRLTAKVPFCDVHLCPLCETTPKEPGEKACKAHRCRTRGCANIVIAPFEFCVDHMCRQCLEEGNFHESAYQVTNTVEYCRAHLCAAKGCKDRKRFGCDYCEHHLCNVLGCGSEVTSDHRFCNQHRCQFEDGCELSCIVVDATPTSYCAEHSCRHCIFQKEKTVSPHQACLKHQLCSHNDCLDLAEAGLYCKYHTPKFADGKCNAIKKKGGSCRGQALDGQFFCKDHKDQALVQLAVKPPLTLSESDYSELPLKEPVNRADLQQPPPPPPYLFRCGYEGCGAISFGNPDWKCGLHGIDLLHAWPEEPASEITNVNNTRTQGTEDCQKTSLRKLLFSHLVPREQNTNAKDEGRMESTSEDEFEEADGAMLRDDFNGRFNADEQELIVDENEELDQENEAQKHFKEIFQEEQDDKEDAVEDLIREEFPDASNPLDLSPEDFSLFLSSLSDHCSWTWMMTKHDREQSFSALLSRLTSLLRQVIILAERHVDAARRDKEEANAAAFKQASVIGGTIVGAAKRLAALRGAEPFAIVVEEACEVMEPTLISVLAVESLQKLELIGDQRQLPAFIQNCWYNIEISNPSIKRSLFERMVETDRENSINPDCTLLDVQRRMRSSISALTKSHYRDVVQIIDDERTKVQKIGDRIPKSFLSEQQRHLRKYLWESGGRLVPGIQSTIFFWNMLENKESRPTAGLSACNDNEAAAVVALAKFLLLCGVPASAITILTPYQGQKRTILSKLKAEKLISYQDSSQNMLLSTVDRYQGDENDIVILSLVRSRPGNRFVSLLNRFIVATSRARLGFYVIGSVQAVVEGFQETATNSFSTGKDQAISSRAYRGLDHWKQFILQLQSEHQQLRRHTEHMAIADSHSLDSSCASYEQETNEDFVDVDSVWSKEDTDFTAFDDLYDNSRVSSLLPLCCPQHRASCQAISSASEQRLFPAKETWASFCAQPCNYKLRCGHKCALPCHLPNCLDHNSKCLERLQRPCDIHCYNPLYCHMVPIANGQTLNDALSVYPCEISVTRSYEACDHPLSLSCEEWKMIDRGEKVMPKCEAIVDDFIQPNCGHRIVQPKCFERQQYQCRPPSCREKVKRTRECGHRVTDECYHIEETLTRRCNCQVNSPRPRCGHPISLKCFEASELAILWDRAASEDALQIDEQCPVRHEVNEEDIYGPAEKSFFPAIKVNCEVLVQFRRSCGHVLKSQVACYRAYRMTAGEGIESVPRCDDLVSARCKLCEREIFVPCHVSKEYNRWDPFSSCPAATPVHESNDTVTIEQAKLHLVASETSDRKLWQLLQSACKHREAINFIRNCKPTNHSVKLHCEQLLNILLGKKPLPPCKTIVTKVLPCSHQKEVECHQYSENVLCMKRPLEPYVFPDCGHSIQVSKCHQLQKMKAENDTSCQRVVEVTLPRCNHTITTVCCQRNTALALAIQGARCRDYVNGDESGELLVKESGIYCRPCEDSPLCDALVTFQRLCHHSVADVPCYRAFQWTNPSETPPPCREMVNVVHPLCGHLFDTECRISSQLQIWTPWEENERPSFQLLQHGNDVHQLLRTDQLWRALPYRQRSFPVEDTSLVLCRQPVLVEFSDCKHVKSFPCATVFENPRALRCDELEAEDCRKCEQLRWFPCCELRSKTREEREQSCSTLVNRLCQVCHINEVEVKCQSSIVQCRRKVKIRLACQHEGQWECGDEEDLRQYHDDQTGRNSRCVQCNIDLWNQVCDWNEIDADAISQYCFAKFSSLLPTVDLRQQILLPSLEKDLERHATARANIIRQLIQSFREGKCASFPPPRWMDDRNLGRSTAAAAGDNAERDLFDFLEDHYEVVFLVMDKQRQPDLNIVGRNRFSTNKQTDYAMGLSIQKLSTDALYAITETEESSSHVKILIGLAFRCQLLKDTPPFLPTGMQALKQADGKKLVHAAEQTKQQFLQKGYDGVEVLAHENDITEFVFWMPGSAVAVGILEFELHAKCQTCGESIPCDRAYGAICARKHLMCWDCFSDYISAASKPDRIHGFVDEDGNLTCPQPDCRISYEMMELVRSVPKQIGEQLIGLKLQVNVAKEAASIQKQEEQKWQAELKKVREMSELEQKVYFLRKKIVDEIFTPQCPRCHTAFLSFDGCFSVTCSKPACGAAFCGWCEMDCGSDAHTHAANCQYNPQKGNVFGREADLKIVRNRIRSKKVRDLLAREPEPVKAKLRDVMHRDFEDIGLAMNF